MKIEMMKTSRLVEYANNPRRNDLAVDAVMASIQEFGFRQPIVCDEQLVVLAGHTRLKAARKLGLTTVPVHVAFGLSEAQQRAYRIADNRTGETAEWDEELLALELEELRMADFDLGTMGFDDGEIDALLATLDANDGETDPDAVPEAPVEPTTKPGDVWQLGRHRLMCGDSTDAASVARLMRGERAALMQTDPPYGIAYVSNAQTKGQSGGHVEIENDDLDGPALQEFLEKVIRAALPVLDDHAAFYLWHPMLTQGAFFAAAAAAADILIHRQIIWVKPSLVFGRGDYHWRHELCFYGWVRGNRPPFYGPRNQTTIWEIGRETSGDHPTAKPVDLWVPPIENHTRAGEVMYEPFSGSGSQIIAAEQTGRRCYAMELSAQYVDVAIKRWEEFTGETAILCQD